MTETSPGVKSERVETDESEIGPIRTIQYIKQVFKYLVLKKKSSGSKLMTGY